MNQMGESYFPLFATRELGENGILMRGSGLVLSLSPFFLPPSWITSSHQFFQMFLLSTLQVCIEYNVLYVPIQDTTILTHELSYLYAFFSQFDMC